MEDLFSLKGKYILVTGGTRGIGRAITMRFAHAGASVVANYVRDIKSAELLLSEAMLQGLMIELCRADLTSSKGIEKILEVINTSGLEVSGLVHCAATGVHRPVSELTTRHLDWTFSLNVRAYFEIVKLLIPKFSKGASIVAVSSAGAERAAPTYAIIGASKGALASLSRHLAVELAPNNIRVNILSPGTVLTDAWNAMPNREERLSERVRRSPNKRLTTPEEVAWAAQFLCSDASAGINGHTLFVDGGERIVE
jgi:NAD(P)-dependent dehydrogenase (short-subunit alcohol dehydrogenase family)